MEGLAENIQNSIGKLDFELRLLDIRLIPGSRNRGVVALSNPHVGKRGEAMSRSSQILVPAATLAVGIAAGLGVARYYDSAGAENQETVATAAKTFPGTKVAATTKEVGPAPSISSAPTEMIASAPLKLRGEGGNGSKVAADTGALDVVEPGRKETPFTEPTPEELVVVSTAGQVSSAQLSSEDTEDLEKDLLLHSTTPIRLSGDSGLLEHERLGTPRPNLMR
jgi:hypothetical protein